MNRESLDTGFQKVDLESLKARKNTASTIDSQPVGLVQKVKEAVRSVAASTIERMFVGKDEPQIENLETIHHGNYAIYTTKVEGSASDQLVTWPDGSWFDFSTGKGENKNPRTWIQIVKTTGEGVNKEAVINIL